VPGEPHTSDQPALKEIIFKRFEQRCHEIVEKHKCYRAELKQDIEELRRNFGDEAVNSRSDLLRLESNLTSKVKPAKEQEAPMSEFDAQIDLVQHVVRSCGANGAEFTTRDVRIILGRKKGVKKTTLLALGSYMQRLTKKLGLISRQESNKAGKRPVTIYQLPHI
jgi:hypothetical protein